MDLIHLDFHGIGDKLSHIIIYCFSWRRKYKQKNYKMINLMVFCFFFFCFVYVLVIIIISEKKFCLVLIK